MKVIKYIAIIATLGLMPISLSAMTVSFGSSDTVAESLNFNIGGTSLLVTAQKVNGDVIFVSQDADGIGACPDLMACGMDLAVVNDPNLDSNGIDEMLVFTITGGDHLYLDNMLLSEFNLSTPEETFNLFVDGAFVQQFNPDTNPVDFGGIVVTTSFAIQATEFDNIESSFRIAGLSARTGTYATALPEPGTLGLLVFGLAVVGLIRRRKSH